MPSGPEYDLDQRQLRARLYDHHRARINRAGGIAGKQMSDVDRLGYAAFGAQRHTAAHEGGVEPIGGIVGAGHLPQPEVRIVGEKLEQFFDRNSRIAGHEIAPARLIAAVDDSDVIGIDAAHHRRNVAFWLGAGRARQRLSLAHQRTQVGVFPFLDAPVRQAVGVETPERVLAQLADRALARQLVARRRKGSAERLLGRGLGVAQFHVHHAASSANCA